MPRRATARRVPQPEASAAIPEVDTAQLTELVKEAPDGRDWVHELKFDGYRMHAWLDRGALRADP